MISGDDAVCIIFALSLCFRLLIEYVCYYFFFLLSAVCGRESVFDLPLEANSRSCKSFIIPNQFRVAH